MTTSDAFVDPGPDDPTLPPQRETARALAKAGLVVSAAYLAARILGYVRVFVVGTTFGADRDLDAFFAAFRNMPPRR